MSRGDCDAEIRTLPYPWQETLWLACGPRISVGETSIQPEAPPILECNEGITRIVTLNVSPVLWYVLSVARPLDVIMGLTCP